jgi:hypothetical protein
MAYEPKATKKAAKGVSKADAAILEEACERFDHVNSVDSENKKAAKEDLQFVYVAGSQWPQEMREQRRLANQPSLEFPQLKQFINQVVNDQRQNGPASGFIRRAARRARTRPS